MTFAPVRLVVGLGNPGREYESTRHNAGFWFVDALARSAGSAFAPEPRFQGEVARTGPQLRLLKPSTYMNASGRAVAAMARFFAIEPAEIMVVHDELDLVPGTVRLKLSGGIAGHNGLRDIRAALGSSTFWRLRIGIGHPRDSEIPQQQVVDYVLKPPRQDELKLIRAAMDRALDAWPLIAAAEFQRALTALHSSASPAGDASPGNLK